MQAVEQAKGFGRLCLVRSKANAPYQFAQHRQSTLGFEGRKSGIAVMLKSKKVVYEYGYDGVAIFKLYR